MYFLKRKNKDFLENWNLHQQLYLCEGVEELQKYFPKLSVQELKNIITLDPTYKGGEQLGKYSKWIIKLVYNNIKNKENIKAYRELLKQYPDGINPKTGKKFNEPVMLPAILDEDVYKIPESLKKYELYKKEIKQPIDVFKTLPDLDKAISDVEKKGLPTNELALKRYNLFKEAMKKGLKKVYEDKDWIVGIPTTLESSVMFGNDTRWCTTSPNGNMYDYYKKRYGGDYYINLDKTDGSLYQFHFESEQFMDEYDRSIKNGFNDLWEEYPNLANFYKSMIESKIGKGKEKNDEYYENKANELLNDTKNIKYWFQNYLSDIKIKNDSVYGKMPVSYIKEIYDEGVSMEFIEQALMGDLWDWFAYDYSNYNINDCYSYKVDWKKIAETNGISVSWDDIEKIWDYDGDFDEESIKELDSVMTPEQAEKIYILLSDDFGGEGISILSLYAQAYRYGSEVQAINTIRDTLIDNLPLDKDEPFSEEDNLNIVFSKNDIIDNMKYIDNAIQENGEEIWWWQALSVNKDDYEPDYSWLQIWRENNFDEIEFTISEPYYGWNDFDEDYWRNCLEYFAEDVKKIFQEK